MSGAVMQLDAVRYAYDGRRHVVDNVSGTLEAGKLHALIGPNGSGKSTLLRLMLGQFRPASGRIALAGEPLESVAVNRRAGLMAYVPQRASVAFAYSVRQVVAMGRYATGPDAAAEHAAMEACDLLELAEVPVVELSVGQQQRVLVARALAQSAGCGRVMLLDEPTSAMDLSHVHRTLGLLREQVALGLAVVVVMQDLNLASRYSDRVWLMERGRLAASGDWNAVLRPEVLEPVYGVKLQSVAATRGGDGVVRPVLDVELPPPVARG